MKMKSPNKGMNREKKSRIDLKMLFLSQITNKALFKITKPRLKKHLNTIMNTTKSISMLPGKNTMHQMRKQYKSLLNHTPRNIIIINLLKLNQTMSRFTKTSTLMSIPKIKPSHNQWIKMMFLAFLIIIKSILNWRHNRITINNRSRRSILNAMHL
jgi:hypothetical protein